MISRIRILTSKNRFVDILQKWIKAKSACYTHDCHLNIVEVDKGRYLFSMFVFMPIFIKKCIPKSILFVAEHLRDKRLRSDCLENKNRLSWPFNLFKRGNKNRPLQRKTQVQLEVTERVEIRTVASIAISPSSYTCLHSAPLEYKNQLQKTQI